MSRCIYRYKYLPDMNGIKGVVRNGTIRFSHPSAFNDPFDCMPSSKLGNLANLQELNPRLYEAWATQSGSPAQRLMGREQSKRILREKIENGELLKRLLEQASVLSLSKIPDSIFEIKECVAAASGSIGRKVEIFKAEFDRSAYAIKIPGFRQKLDIPQLVR